MAMFRMRCKKNGYRLTEEAETYAKEFFEDMYKNRDDNFGNGRDVRNRFEDIISRQANRLAAMEAPTKDDLMTITKPPAARTTLAARRSKRCSRRWRTTVTILL